ESHHRAFFDEIVSRMAPGKRDRILELGCGEGWAARLLSAMAPEGMVVGIDISDEMIYNARVKSASTENAMFLVGEAEDIPWQDSFFSKAFAIESFYYYPNTERALREAFRVLSPGGSIWILNHLSQENPLSLRWLDHIHVPVQILPAAEYETLMRQCGFV